VASPHNLPAELTSFVGREPQVAELRRLLRKSRLITLTGPGGAGKTRLALRLASQVLDRYPGGTWLVELGALSDPLLLEQTVAAACGVREQKKRRIIELLITSLVGRRTLLVFDGGEHLVDASATLARRLLRACPDLSLLVTSREPLGVRGEVIWRTPSLTVPDPDHRRIELLRQSEAVRLFVDRARLAQPRFVLERSTSGDLAEICTRLEGLPLAIELAASLVDVMTLPEIRARLSDRFRLLTGAGRSAVPRYQALRQAIDWSFDLLTPAEKELFVRLAVFADGFEAEAAEAIGIAPGQPTDVLTTLLRLVDKSLVIAERGSSKTRFRLLDTIREYALEKLQHADSGEARRKHAMYFVDFCKEAAPKLRLAEQVFWLGRIEDEEANIRLALAWCQSEAPDQLMLLTGYVNRYWYVRGKFREGLEWLDKALDSSSGGAEARIAALQARARLRRHHADYEGARVDAQECADLARQSGVKTQLMGALTTLGTLSSAMGQLADAERFYVEALELQQELGDSAMIAGGLNNLALVDSARGNHASAKARLELALEEARKADDQILRAIILDSAGRVERRLGAFGTSRRKYLEALAISAGFEDVLNIADVLDGLALLALSERDPARTLVLIAASSRQRAISNSERSPWEEKEDQHGVAKARSRLSPRAADAAGRRGSALSLADAVAYASGGSGSTSPLTAREMQVGSLVEEGMTNAEIARRLKIAERTVDAHLEHIRNKLGLRTRAQIAVWAHDQVAMPATG
jgi:non-specific serine/threonine protein kinase